MKPPEKSPTMVPEAVTVGAAVAVDIVVARSDPAAPAVVGSA